MGDFIKILKKREGITGWILTQISGAGCCILKHFNSETHATKQANVNISRLQDYRCSYFL